MLKLFRKTSSNLILIFALVSSCEVKQDQAVEDIADNPELTAIYKNDQGDRQSDNINWYEVSKRDSARRSRVHELLDSGKVRTSADYQNAAMVFQHGSDSTSYGMAVKLMRKSIELDSTANKWLLAAATDRYLLSVGKPQIYGTQYQKFGDGPWQLGEMDTTRITDAERREFGVETLAQQREKVRRMNMKQLSELATNGKSIDDIIKFIRAGQEQNSEYDLSESAINNFGYHLMSEGNDEAALKIFELNTQLFPEGSNTYDSYGECLMKMGQKEKAIAAYKKSLELDPDNDNARKVIEEHTQK